jgi:Cft2 family RNA processing exonuclease
MADSIHSHSLTFHIKTHLSGALKKGYNAPRSKKIIAAVAFLALGYLARNFLAHLNTHMLQPFIGKLKITLEESRKEFLENRLIQKEDRTQSHHEDASPASIEQYPMSSAVAVGIKHSATASVRKITAPSKQGVKSKKQAHAAASGHAETVSSFSSFGKVFTKQWNASKNSSSKKQYLLSNTQTLLELSISSKRHVTYKVIKKMTASAKNFKNLEAALLKAGAQAVTRR